MENLQELVIKFRDERDWKQFHNPKDCALSLVLEATEVLEHFQWKNGKDLDKVSETNKEEISHELADVLYWVLLMSNDLGINISDALKKKLKISGKKYPINKAKGKSDKYTQLR